MRGPTKETLIVDAEFADKEAIEQACGNWKKKEPLAQGAAVPRVNLKRGRYIYNAKTEEFILLKEYERKNKGN